MELKGSVANVLRDGCLYLLPNSAQAAACIA